MAIGLQSLEDFLRIMQHRGAGIERDRTARHDPGIVPASAFVPVDPDHVIGKQFAETRIGDRLVASGRRHRVGVFDMAKFVIRRVGHGVSLGMRRGLIPGANKGKSPIGGGPI